MANKKYDLIVIGTGSAGASAAMMAKNKGWSVAIIDCLPFGGTCALRGCDPKKILVGAAELINWTKRMKEKSVVKNQSQINWQKLINFKKTFTDPLPAGNEKWFKEKGIATYKGAAKFISKNKIEVAGYVLEGKFILIASGAEPMKLGIEGEEHFITSDEFLELKSLPKDVIFVGGGYISLEFAHIAVMAGSKVTVLHRGERPLEKFEPRLVEELVKSMKGYGINLVLNTQVVKIKKEKGKFVVFGKQGGKNVSFKGSLVVHGAGRVANIDELDLERAGVKVDKRGVTVNEYLQSVSNTAVYAAGDAAASKGLQLTPIAGLEGKIAAKNILEGNKYKVDYTATPTVVFTLPPLSAVGLTESQAKEKNLKFKVNQQSTSSWYSSKRIGLEHSAFKVLIEKDTDKILGAHIFGHNSEEIINIFALVIKNNIKAADLKKTIWAYPTSASDISYMV